MNILILTTKLPYPAKDGGAIATLNMAAGLADLGCQVKMLAMNTAKHYFPPDQLPRELKKKIDFHVVDTDTEIRWTALLWNLLFSRRPYHSVRFHSGAFLFKLEKLLHDHHFDIIQLEGPYLDYCLPLIRKTCDAKISFRAHNIEHEIWSRRAGYARNPFKRMYFSMLSVRIKKLEKLLISLVDMVLPISPRDHNIFLQLGLEKPSLVCPAGIDTRTYPDPAAAPAFSLAFIGALDWGPNQEGLSWFLDHVWKQLSILYPDLKIHVAGRNPDHFFSDYKNDPRIIIEGEVEDAGRFINSHPVMIIPLFSGSGIRIKILEAMLLERLVITTPIGAEGLDVTHKKNILIAGTPSEFIENIGLAHEKDLQRQIGMDARKFIMENFDNFDIVKKVVHFYKEIL
ncbi:MAG: hypothetical protein AMS27_03670 [Bacteroides sp. SM23_62_1]|nr:MAG: hypothetical protein AMS27_03670 [Bacteroides sp. SM23_62_1]